MKIHNIETEHLKQFVGGNFSNAAIAEYTQKQIAAALVFVYYDGHDKKEIDKLLQDPKHKNLAFIKELYSKNKPNTRSHRAASKQEIEDELKKIREVPEYQKLIEDYPKTQ